MDVKKWKVKYKIRCSCRKSFTGIVFEDNKPVTLGNEDGFYTIQLDGEQKPREIIGNAIGGNVEFECPNCQKIITKDRINV